MLNKLHEPIIVLSIADYQRSPNAWKDYKHLRQEWNNCALTLKCSNKYKSFCFYKATGANYFLKCHRLYSCLYCLDNNVKKRKQTDFGQSSK
jgi:hypothetical protein